MTHMQFSFSQLIRRAANINAGSDAVFFADCSRSWRETLNIVTRFAAALRGLGLQPGDRVAMLAFNSDIYLQFYFAVPWAGGVLVPVNTRLAPAEIVYWINDSGSRLVLVDEAFAPVLAQISAQLTSVEKYIYVGSGEPPPGCESLAELISAAAPVEDAGRGGSDLVALFYTGGTTGRSKGVMLTHAGMVANTLQWCVSLGVSRDDRVLVAAPMFHLVAGLNCVAAALLGAGVSLLARFDPTAVLTQIQDRQATKIALVPTMIHALVHHPEVARFDLRSLRRVSYGGAPMSEALLDRALQVLPHTQFYQVYGQTEAGPSISMLPPDYHVRGEEYRGKMASAGQPMPAVEVTIRDARDAEVAAGIIGEICVRAPAVSPGYWNQPEQTEHAFRGGWLHTGDAGYLDADGFLYVVDRVKDMIISGGENVYSAEVEQVIHRHAAVAECVVIGIPDEVWGEQVHAIVRLREGARVTEQELIEHCRGSLAGYKCVRSVDFRTEPFPLSGANKILKRELRAAYWKGRTRNV